MANTYHQVYLQAIFAVKYRRALIDKAWNSELFAVTGNTLNESMCKTVIVNDIEDHVHCMFGLKPIQSISEVMKAVKARSSRYINDHKLTPARFEWQEGYGVFSYSQSQVNNVYQYIKNQEAHHKNTTFRTEYLELLKEFDISFDEKYVFAEPL